MNLLEIEFTMIGIKDIIRLKAYIPLKFKVKAVC